MAVSDTDWMTKHNAIHMAKDIETYWHKRGYTNIHCSVVPTYGVETDSRGGFVIRSNMVNGLPPLG